MQILRLLAARRAAALGSQRRDAGENDEGPFFDLHFASSFRVSFSSSVSDDSDSDESCAELDFIISLQRSSSATPLKICASEPPTSLQSQQRHGERKRGITMRSLSFGARKAAPLYRRPSSARSSSGRHSFARSSTSSAGSLRLFMNSPPNAMEEDEHVTDRTRACAPSRDVIRRCLAKISRRIHTAASPRSATAVASRGLRRLRKCRSASSLAPASRHDDDSAVQKQDGIASAITHCKESLHVRVRVATGKVEE